MGLSASGLCVGMQPMRRLHALLLLLLCSPSFIPSFLLPTRLPMRVSPIHHHTQRSAAAAAPSPPTRSNQPALQPTGWGRAQNTERRRGWKSKSNGAKDPVIECTYRGHGRGRETDQQPARKRSLKSIIEALRKGRRRRRGKGREGGRKDGRAPGRNLEQGHIERARLTE